VPRRSMSSLRSGSASRRWESSTSSGNQAVGRAAVVVLGLVVHNTDTPHLAVAVARTCLRLVIVRATRPHACTHACRTARPALGATRPAAPRPLRPRGLGSALARLGRRDARGASSSGPPPPSE
jgi:hypothetical protein